jgi:isochorismate synthase
MQEVLPYTDSIAKALRICLDKKIHFAAYRLPGNNDISIVIQRDPELKALDNLSHVLPKQGFLIAPFSRKQDKTYLIKPEILIQHFATPGQLQELDALPENRSLNSTRPGPEDTRREEYIHLIRDTISRIHAGEFEKVVLSRIKAVPGKFMVRLPEIFSILCDSYPNAFVYLFCVNGQCWTGATPEPFICSRGRELITVSLAGTRSYQKPDLDISNWNRKELQEQDYVTFHIEKILKNFAICDYTRNGPYVAGAGNLLHLRTDFSFSLTSVGNRMPSLIHALHPTPAVCGMSTGKAMDFIMNTEKHNREYYTGFLGPVGLGDLIQLYVNLRCMKVHENRLALYIGGGITHDSVAEDEWEETEIKADTLLSVLHQIV